MPFLKWHIGRYHLGTQIESEFPFRKNNKVSAHQFCPETLLDLVSNRNRIIVANTSVCFCCSSVMIWSAVKRDLERL